MDWYLAPRDRAGAAELRREIGEYLRRHAADPGRVPDAELAVEELLGNAVRHTDGPVWVSIEWADLAPTVAIADLGEEFDLTRPCPTSWTRVGVGGQMEEEYRLAREITGRLCSEQLADCYVRLKHAIDGDFYVIELTPDRIVLGNRRCPFGDVVTRAPSLCRMTSSVFGGIAADNAGGALHEAEPPVHDPRPRGRTSSTTN